MSTLPKKKLRTAFFCSRCGAEHSRWQGQCRECGEWNTLIEERIPDKRVTAARSEHNAPQPLASVDTRPLSGHTSGIVEFDRVLGGQLLPGMTVLVGGEPGIGKSTLLLQAAGAYAASGLSVLYVSGEESLAQIRLRATRLGLSQIETIAVLNTTSLDEIMAAFASNNYHAAFIDSIQTVASDQLDSPPGTVGQVRESAHQLITHAKSNDIALFLVGHVTKDGMVAGPKVLEHMVDTVLYFEGDSSQLYRLLRAVKNRFGSVSEIGIFEMGAKGLIEVANPSSLFLSGHTEEPRSGAVVAALCEGNRPLLVEVQALVTQANYGSPQRVAGGFDSKRLALLLAIIEKRCDYPMGQNDVFVSIAGGLRVNEPALDLPIIVAIVSSLLNKPLDSKLMVIGEVGLSGEVRGITMIDRRVTEAQRLGFKTLVIPNSNREQLPEKSKEIVGVSGIQSAIDLVLN
jgi:DNA repair protein RadA/Sms